MHQESKLAKLNFIKVCREDKSKNTYIDNISERKGYPRMFVQNVSRIPFDTLIIRFCSPNANSITYSIPARFWSWFVICNSINDNKLVHFCLILKCLIKHIQHTLRWIVTYVGETFAIKEDRVFEKSNAKACEKRRPVAYYYAL